MALVLTDRVEQFTRSTGQDDLVLEGNLNLRQTFFEAAGDGDEVIYVLEDVNGTDYEIGRGTFTAPNQLSRDSVRVSTNNDQKIDLTAGVHRVFSTVDAKYLNDEEARLTDHIGSTDEHPVATQSVPGFQSAADKTKLDGIEPGATADQTAAEIKTLYESNANTNAFTDADESKLDGIEAGAQVNVATNLSNTPAASSVEVASSTGTNTILASATQVVAGVLSAADKTKLDGIESGATADQTASEIKSLYESNANTNAFTDADESKLDGIEAGAEVNVATNLSRIRTTTDVVIQSSTGTNVAVGPVSTVEAGVMSAADKTKLDGIESGATADQTAAEIKTAYESNANTNAFTDADESKLDGIEAGAQVNPAKATTIQAEAHTDDTAYMTALKTYQSFGQYGFADFSDNVTGDADAQVIPGSFIWLNSAATNKPAGTGAGLLFILSAPNLSTLSQIFVEAQTTGAAEIWLRVRNNTNSVWGAWNKLITESMKASTAQAEAGTDDTNFMTALKTTQSFNQYGLGLLNSAALPGDDLDNNDIPAGIGYRYDSNTLGTKPPGSNFGYIWCAKLNGSAAVQIAIDFASGVMWTRADSDGLGFNTWAQATNVPTDLSRSLTSTQITITSSTGNNTSVPGATASLAGVMIAADKSKLDGIAANANNYVHPTQAAIDVNATNNGVNVIDRVQVNTLGHVTAVSTRNLSNATTSAAGVMSATDKSKLDGIQAGAQVNVGTNITVTEGSTTVTIASSTGSNDSIAAATTSLAGVMTAADKTKLNGIESGAQVNVGTNLSRNLNADSVSIFSSTGTDITIPSASISSAGVLSGLDKQAINALGTNANRDLTISTSTPSGGADGDVWYQYE